MVSQLVRKCLSVMAHTTTIIAFGTAIWGLLFPAQAADYVSRFLDEVQSARASLEQIEGTSAATATATEALADRMADRPRFSAESHITSRQTVTQGGAPVHQFQMQLENLTDRAITDLLIVIEGTDGTLSSNLLANTVPPYETHTEITTGIPASVCYSYGWDGQYYTELRALEISPSPIVDQMGNASTYGFNHFGYDLQTEADADSFTCGANGYTRSGLAARQVELDAAAQ